MKEIKIICTFLCFLLLASGGCAGINFSKYPNIHPVPGSDISIEDNKILHNGEVFAELKYFFTANLSDNPGEAYLFSAKAQHRGLAIYYNNTKSLVWIFPENGREGDVKRGYFLPRGQTDGYSGWVYDIAISDDGRFVYYKTPGLMSTSYYAFSVEHGISKLIDRDWRL